MKAGKPLHRGPAAAELISAVAEFLESRLLPAAGADRQTRDEIAAAAHALHVVERELFDPAASDTDFRDVLAGLGFSDEAQLAKAIRRGKLDDRADEVMSCLRTLANDRLAVAHPEYRDE